jgi:LacI family transcriptional regulator
VLECAAELNYVANRWARSLVTNKSFMIGIVIPDISHTFFAEITRGVEETLDPEGYDLLLCHSRGDSEREKSEIDVLVGSRVDGLIVASEQPANSPEIFLSLQARAVPFVLVDRFFPELDCPWVRADDVNVGRIATEHLIALGHTRIGHIGGPPVSTARLREKGYREALAGKGIGVEERWMVQGSFTRKSGREAMRHFLAMDSRPTAIFTANDPMAIGAVEVCREAGLSVPGDISIVGAGDIEGSVALNPFLTTVDWPRLELGRTAARMLLDLVRDDAPLGAATKTFTPSLIVRTSSGPPPAGK